MSVATAPNPFTDTLRFERRVPECAIVIFGASGDLSRRKLLPALYQLALDRRLPENFTIVGNSRLFIGQAVYTLQGTAGNVPLAAAFTVVPMLIMGVYLWMAKRMGAFDVL